MSALTARENELLDRAAARIAAFGMNVPAIFLLESVRPLNTVGAQMLAFLTPMLAPFFSAADLREVVYLLDKRGAIDALLDRVERQEAGREARRDAAPAREASARR